MCLAYRRVEENVWVLKEKFEEIRKGIQTKIVTREKLLKWGLRSEKYV